MSIFTQFPLESTDEDAYLSAGKACRLIEGSKNMARNKAILPEKLDIDMVLNIFTSNKRIYCLYIVVER